MVEDFTGDEVLFVDHIAMGDWLNLRLQGNSKYLASLIATTIWFILKCRCDYIFRQKEP